jgi:hypothetical protein
VIRVTAERGYPKRLMRRIESRLAASPELRQMDVGDPDLSECRRESLPAELRVPPRARLRPNVRKRLDIGPAQARDQLLEGSRAVTDGPDFHEISVEDRRMRWTYHSIA